MGRKGALAAQRTLIGLGCIDDSISDALLKKEIRRAIMTVRKLDNAFRFGTDATGAELFDAVKTKRLGTLHDLVLEAALADQWNLPMQGVQSGLTRLSRRVVRRIKSLQNAVWRDLRLELLNEHKR